MDNVDKAVSLRELIGDWKKDEREWKDAMLMQFRTLNGTVASHTTSIALLVQTDEQQAKDAKAICDDLKEVGKKVRAVEMAQVKAGVVCGLIGAAIAGLPPLIIALRAVAK